MTTAKRTPPLCGDNLWLLQKFSCGGWVITSAWLKWHSHVLRPSARISELRLRYGINIVAHSRMVNGRKHTTFKVPPEDQHHAWKVLLAALRNEREAK